MALNTFQQFGMIEIIDGVITIPNWEKHQNLDKLELAREQTRQRVAKHRAKQKQLAECNALCNADVTLTEEDKEEDKDIEKDNKREKSDFQSVVNLFHSICISYPKIKSLSEARKKAIKARLNTYSIDDFKTVFENAEASSFLKGSNDRNWSATFDWMMKDSNFAKVLDGNYADQKAPRPVQNKMKPSLETGDAEKNAFQKILSIGDA